MNVKKPKYFILFVFIFEHNILAQYQEFSATDLQDLDSSNFFIDNTRRDYLSKLNSLCQHREFGVAAQMLYRQTQHNLDGLAYYCLEYLRGYNADTLARDFGNLFFNKLLSENTNLNACMKAAKIITSDQKSEIFIKTIKIIHNFLMASSAPDGSNNLVAQYLLAYMLYKGIYVARNLEMAELWAKRSFQQYYIPAANILARIKLEAGDFKEAQEYMDIALGIKDNLVPPYFPAYLIGGLINLQLKNYKAAYRYLSNACENGIIEATIHWDELNILKNKLDQKNISEYNNQDILNFFRFKLINLDDTIFDSDLIDQFELLFTKTKSPYAAAILCYMLNGTRILREDKNKFKETVVKYVQIRIPVIMINNMLGSWKKSALGIDYDEDFIEFLVQIDFLKILKENSEWSGNIFADENYREFYNFMSKYLDRYFK